MYKLNFEHLYSICTDPKITDDQFVIFNEYTDETTNDLKLYKGKIDHSTSEITNIKLLYRDGMLYDECHKPFLL